MNKTRKVKGILEVLLVIGLILIIPLFFAIKSVANAPVAQGTGTPYTRATATSVPLSTPSISSSSPVQTNAKQPPACTFPLARITTSASAPENYTFSEPQVVLTAPQGNIYSIAEWLPDNQQVLMTEALFSSMESGSGTPPQESIDLFNPETGESKVYATRPYTEDPPAWQAGLNAVVYPAMNFLGMDQNTHQPKLTRQMWVSYGNPDTARLLADNLSQFPLAIKPGGSETVYLSDKKISKLDKSLQNIASTTFDATQWDYAKSRRNALPVSYEMAWQPGTSLIFLYSNGSINEMGGYTFILDANTGQVCELNMGGWANKAHWSSDGRYLAIVRSVDYSFPIASSDLTVLDTTTGHLYTLGVIPQDTDGKHYVYDFAWAPDDRHLLAVGSTPSPQNNQSENDLHGLYLVDFVSGQSINILPEYNRFFSNGLAWSPDGSKLVIRCLTHGVDRMCFISVKKTGQ